MNMSLNLTAYGKPPAVSNMLMQSCLKHELERLAV
jgi:hypothetical protein